MSRFTGGSFEADLKSTIGVEFSTKRMHVHHKTVQVQLWDTGLSLL